MGSAIACLIGFGPGVAAAQTAAEENEVESVVVTGTRLTSALTAPTPVTTLGAEVLTTRGTTLIVDALNEIPAFRNAQSTTRGTGGSFAVGQAILDLRGLGGYRTLALIDGRRHVPNNVVGATAGTWDSNVLPSSLVERVDVVTGGASAAYGSDAVAGVVNFILNDRLEGFKAGVQYGGDAHGGRGTFSANFAGGRSFAEGKGHIVFGVDFLNSEKTRALDYGWAREQIAIFPIAGPRAPGVPANILAPNVHYAIPFGGLVTSCATAAGPLAPCPIANLTFENTGAVRPFQFGSPRGSILMAGGEGVIQYHNQNLAISANRVATLGRVTYEVAPNFTVWGEGSYGRFHTEGNTVDYVNTGSIVILRDNPYLPAALAAQMDAAGITRFNMSRVNYGDRNGLSPGNVNKFWQGAVGFRADVFQDWKVDGYFSQGRSKFKYQPRYLTALPEFNAALYAVRDAGGNIVCGPTATNPMYAALPAAQRAAFLNVLTSPCVPFNPFGPSAESAAASNYVAPEDIVSITTYDQQAAAINFSGSPFATWAGDVSVAVGAEWRDEDVKSELNALNTRRVLVSAYNIANPQPGSGHVSVKEGYAEVGIPLLKDAPLAQNFDLNGAIRYTDYSSVGSVTTWKVGATWDVVDALRFRLTRSRDIRAPSIPELFYRGNDGFGTFNTPLGSNSGPTSAANNPDLDPEKANTWTAGVVFRPTWEWARGFQASADYYRIKLNGVIGSVPLPNVINGCFLQGRADYCAFLTLDPSQPSGVARADIPLLNLNALETDGFDVNATYRAPEDLVPGPGQWAITFNGTYLNKQKTFGPDGTLLSDAADITSKYRWTTNVNYRIGAFSTTLTARYNSSFHGSFVLIGPDDPRYNPASQLSVSDNLWPGMVYYSLQAEYAFETDSNQKFTVYGIVDNLFSKDQPAGAYWTLNGLGSPAGGFNPYDLPGRVFKVGVRATF
jgi:outer membrane receptor protein involved in Fe transport